MVKLFLNLSISVMFFLFIGCKSCGKSLYAVHEKIEYLDIIIKDTSLPSNVLIKYVDSVVSQNIESYSVERSLNGVDIKEKERVICFKRAPEECYLISFNSSPCWIMGISKKNINSNEWIYEKNKLNDTEIIRIKNRFETEILNKFSRAK